MPIDSKTWLPTLDGPTLHIRPIREDDFDGLHAAANDPDIWRLHSEPERYKREVFKTFFDKATCPPAALVVIDKATKQIIGSSRYYDYNAEAGSVVVGYTFLACKYWGGKTNRELKQLMLNYAFERVEKVLFHTSEGNFRSQRAIERLGASRRGDIIDLPGIGRRVEYTLIKSNWLKSV